MIALFAALFIAVPARAQAPKNLPEAQRQAREAVAAVDPHRLAPLRRDLDKLADALDEANEHGRPGEEEEPKSLEEIAREGRETVKSLRPPIDPRLAPSLDALDELYQGLPGLSYAEPWGGELQRIIAEQLRWAGENAASVDELNALLRSTLVLPGKLPEDADVEDQAFWPVEIPLKKFKKLDPIRVFLLKHRLKHPPHYAQTTANQIVDGRHNVEAGVIIEGVVTWNTQGSEFDQDWCFNIGNLHVELTPEWRLLHPHILKPKVGDHVRLKGWTYYDYFHKAEHEWDPKDPMMGDMRYTLWEIHPVQEIETLP